MGSFHFGSIKSGSVFFQLLYFSRMRWDQPIYNFNKLCWLENESARYLSIRYGIINDNGMLNFNLQWFVSNHHHVLKKTCFPSSKMRTEKSISLFRSNRFKFSCVPILQGSILFQQSRDGIDNPICSTSGPWTYFIDWTEMFYRVYYLIILRYLLRVQLCLFDSFVSQDLLWLSFFKLIMEFCLNLGAYFYRFPS